MKLRSAISSGAPRFCSLNSVRNSWPSGSAISSPSISRLMEKAWPARMERARKSSASGNCSSSVSSRFLRLCAHEQVGQRAEEERQHNGRGRAVEQERHQQARARSPAPSSAPSQSAGAWTTSSSPPAGSAPARAWRTAAAEQSLQARSACPDSISFSRLLTFTAVSPEAVCSMPTTCFLRRASKNFSPTLTASRHEREHDDERNDHAQGHLVNLHHRLEHLRRAA